MQNYKKILLATMSFDIGGVETHVLELATCLKNLGYIPIVVSNGGVYTRELLHRGITHIKLPLHDKNPKHILDSYILLKKLILKEQIDIVHAHARIPAFTLGLLHKNMHFPFVTSAHSNFNTLNPIYKFNSNWGQASIAVSHDLKQYLIDKYKIEPKNILVSINGINPNTFQKNLDTHDIEEAFRIDRSKTIIGHISRLDKSRALAAFQLVELAPKLYTLFPDTRLLIVGDGNYFEHIQSKVNHINATLGLDYIILTGASTEVNKFLAISDIFVGVSRAALEAMCMKCPTILAGNEGYIGIFDPSKLDLAIETNFTCRGELLSNPKLLLEDLSILLRMSKTERDNLGEYGREVVVNHYSVEKMTYDHLKLYDKVWKKG
ncbi:hypothetical protein AN643_03300 [Candidatus Epulonipiscioides saccharophilum]|nr:hypothetical protein AN643_03300 [Epulopiscium sp. SCG-B10WGA-EpuloB]